MINQVVRRRTAIDKMFCDVGLDCFQFGSAFVVTLYVVREPKSQKTFLSLTSSLMRRSYRLLVCTSRPGRYELRERSLRFR